jgi:hypothetical protein
MEVFVRDYLRDAQVEAFNVEDFQALITSENTDSIDSLVESIHDLQTSAQRQPDILKKRYLISRLLINLKARYFPGFDGDLLSIKMNSRLS